MVSRELTDEAVWIWNSQAGQALVKLVPAQMHTRLARYFNDRQMLIDLNNKCAEMKSKGQDIMFQVHEEKGLIPHPQVAIRKDLMARLKHHELALNITIDDVEDLEEDDSEAPATKGNW